MEVEYESNGELTPATLRQMEWRRGNFDNVVGFVGFVEVEANFVHDLLDGCGRFHGKVNQPFVSDICDGVSFLVADVFRCVAYDRNYENCKLV